MAENKNEVSKEVEKPKEEVKKEEVELVKVATEYGLAYQLPTGEVVNSDEYRVWMGNLLWKINKAVA